MTLLYELVKKRRGGLTVVDIFPQGRWRKAALLHILMRSDMSFRTAIGLLTIVLHLAYHLLARYSAPQGMWPRQTHYILYMMQLFGASKSMYASAWWWRFYLAAYELDGFEEDYRQAWRDTLTGLGPVVEVTIFIGKDALRVPILFDRNDPKVGNDRQTFEALRMWYSFMQVRRGFGEVLLPKRLIRIDKVNVCNAIAGTAVLGSRISAFELGRSGVGHVANFEDPSGLPTAQRYQTALMIENAESEGLEFIRTWDTTAISIIALAPFLFSLIFSAFWIGVSVGKYGVDAQTAVQTAFTVAAFIVTAGALLIALFAFLDTQAQKSE